jgi:hypothetical protein
VVHFYSKTNEMHQFLKFILFFSRTPYVADGLSVHHQESKTVHTASGICQTDSAECLLAGMRWNWFSQFHLVPASKQSAESVWHKLDAICTVLDCWWWTERPSETCTVLLQNKINLRIWCISWVLLKNISPWFYTRRCLRLIQRENFSVKSRSDFSQLSSRFVLH